MKKAPRTKGQAARLTRPRKAAAAAPPPARPVKLRLDLLLVERALAPSREKAARHILAGDVFVDGQRVDKAGTLVDTRAGASSCGVARRS